MAERGRTDWRVVGCAVVVGAAIALPAGMYIGERRAESEVALASGQPEPGQVGGPSRNVYLPEFRSDPYVLDQQRRVAEALTASCRQSNLHCEEAEQAWQRIREAEAGR